jgi:hydrogenase expression/formation protein HypC
MCLAIPGKIVSIDEAVPGLKMAMADFGGLTRKICVEWVDAELGDYIIAHAGLALARVDTDEAKKTIESFAAIARSLENETS